MGHCRTFLGTSGLIWVMVGFSRWLWVLLDHCGIFLGDSGFLRTIGRFLWEIIRHCEIFLGCSELLRITVIIVVGNH